MRETRADHRIPAYQHKEVTLDELRQKNEKLIRRLLWMAWPNTAEATLHRLRTDAMSFSPEDSTKTTVIADIRNRDIARNTPANNPGGPMFTVTMTLDEREQTTPRITDARIRVKRIEGDFGESASDIEEAVMRMELITALTKTEYEQICERLRPLRTAKRQAAILHLLLDLKGQ